MIFKKIEKIYRDQIYTRCDDNGSVFYFSSDDFEGLNKLPYPFKSSKGHTLQGYFYFYEGYKNDRIVMFEHGMGSGHRGYMKEIELLARHGYLVFSYDHTGCMESGGETTGGFVHSIIDLDDAISALRADEKYSSLDISIVGHSWGAYSTLNISNFTDGIKHLVALSGPISLRALLKQSFGGLLSPIGDKLYKKELAQNPKYVPSDAITALSKTSAKVLIIHSDDDKIVKCERHFDVMKKALADKENIKFVKVHGKAHNPNYTEDSVAYKDSFFEIYKKALGERELDTDEAKTKFKSRFDWNRMTAQDENIWKMIFETLDA